MLLRLDHGQYKSTAEAAVDAVRVILQQCAESKTVKRVIHTASMSTASPLKNGRWGSWSSRAVDLGCGGRGGRVGEEGGETRGRRSGAAAAALAREVGRPRGGWPRITTARCGSGPARPGARSRRPSGARRSWCAPFKLSVSAHFISVITKYGVLENLQFIYSLLSRAPRLLA
jgi:hypothetical protein